LDLFCGRTGGATVGYQRAGFHVTGIDLASGKQYPGDEFIRDDVLNYLNEEFLSQFDVIHASPPCQLFSRTQHLRDAQGKGTDKINLIPATRDALQQSRKPYVIENVPGSPLIDPVLICGSSFELGVRRHRLFETNVAGIVGTECNHKRQGRPIGVYGSKNDNIPSGGQTAKTLEEGKRAMGIDWDCSWAGLVESIPPLYTTWIGLQIKEAIFYD
jgi:DNA (cytosine-5)-methyltransferase 1